MTKIQLKRSNVLEGGKAKEPTAPNMEFGELAVNYNANDPVIFIKDSDNNIIRIATGNALGNIPSEDGSPHQPGTLDDRYVEITGDNMTGNLTLGTNKITLDASGGSATFVGKVTSASTASNDAAATLTTKDYVDSIVGGNAGKTDISITHAATTATVNSSTGTNGQINAATTSLAGVMTSADKTKLDGIAAGAQVNVGTNLSNTPSTTAVAINSSTGTDTSIPAATTTAAGVMTSADKTKLDGIPAGGGAGATNLDNIPTSTIVTVTSSTGTDTDLPGATTSLAGVMTSADKSKLDGIADGAQVNVGTDLSNTPASTTVTVDSSTGNNTILPAATTTAAGVMTSADKTKLDGIEAGAQVNVGTNLSNTPSATNVAVNSSTGTGTTLPAATTTDAGVMTSADKTKLDGIAAGAQVNVATNLGNSPTTTTVTVTSSTGTDTNLPGATTSLAGVMTSADKTKLDSAVQPGDDVSFNDIDISGSYVSDITAVSALDINCASGNYFTKTINANSTFTFSNVPASKAYSFTLELTHTSGTVTWPSSVKFPNDISPMLTNGKTHLFMFVTDDGGTRFRGTALVNYVN